MVVNLRKSLRVACMVPPGMRDKQTAPGAPFIMRIQGEVKYSTNKPAGWIQFFLSPRKPSEVLGSKTGGQWALTAQGLAVRGRQGFCRHTTLGGDRLSGGSSVSVCGGTGAGRSIANDEEGEVIGLACTSREILHGLKDAFLKLIEGAFRS